METLLRELYGHQAWADAESWRALEATPAALDDNAVHTRLHHLHLVQRAFLDLVQGRAVRITKPEDYPDPARLKAEARAYHAEAAAFVDTVSDARLAETITVPWFKEPPLQLSVARALAQAALHSQHHRAQNATRLRELGGRPPGTDLIIWYWKGQPAAQWS